MLISPLMERGLVPDMPPLVGFKVIMDQIITGSAFAGVNGSLEHNATGLHLALIAHTYCD